MAFARPPGALGRALRSLALLLAFAAALALAPPAEAMLAVEASVQQLVAESDMAVDAMPEESYSTWEDIPKVGRRIVTYTRMRVTDAAFGDVPGEVWVRTLGGHVGDIGQRVEGEAEFSKGSRAVVFLRRVADALSALRHERQALGK
jgi:hypothetical protein